VHTILDAASRGLDIRKKIIIDKATEHSQRGKNVIVKTVYPNLSKISETRQQFNQIHFLYVKALRYLAGVPLEPAKRKPVLKRKGQRYI